jgi:aminoglycoside phosphotransferase (APT) family kinase protein
LHASGVVRVPEPLFLEPDPSIVGLPFFVMARVEGHVPVGSPHFATAGFLFDASVDQRRSAWHSAVSQLASIARVPLDQLPFLDRPDYGPNGLSQEREYWKRAGDWACEGEVPDWLLDLESWLCKHAPNDPDGMSWGDARIGNMSFDHDFRVKAVFDWEQATNAGVRQDLGWWLFFDRYQTEGLGHARLDGFGTRGETVDLWQEVSGVPAGDQVWYEAFAGYKLSIIGVRAFMLRGDPNARSISANPVPRLATQCAGLTPREG